MFKIFRKILRFLFIVSFSAAIVFSTLFAWFGLGYEIESKTIEPRIAFWMQHAWSTGEEDNFAMLQEQIEEYEITDLYFHVGPLGENGELASDLNIDTTSLDVLSTTNYAWIGQIRNEIDLSNPEVRAGIIASCQWVLGQGFDGIHVDIEPVRNDDTDFYELIKEMDAALPTTPISVAMDQWQPQWLSDQFNRLFKTDIESFWNTGHVLDVARYADEMVVMTYDTGLPESWMYSWWVEQQTIYLSKILEGEAELMIGLPSYSEGASFDSEVENILSGFAGFEKGVSNLRTKKEGVHGFAIYSYWEMEEQEWTQFGAWLSTYDERDAHYNYDAIDEGLDENRAVIR